MNKIGSKIDFRLESCYANYFVCGEPFSEPPKLDRTGRLDGRAMVLSVVVDEDGYKEDTEERICDKCWKSDLSRFEG